METEPRAIDFSRLCRVCNTESSSMSPLFVRNVTEGPGLDDMLISCTNLNILETDGFPNSICNHCINDLKVAYRFKQQCENTDRYYKELGVKSIAETTSDSNKQLHSDYIFVLKISSRVMATVLTCGECYWTFNTLIELKNHKETHSKNEIKEEQNEAFTEISLELNQEKEVIGRQTNEEGIEGNFEMVRVPTEIKEEHEQSLAIMETTVFMEGEKVGGHLELKEAEDLRPNNTLEKNSLIEDNDHPNYTSNKEVNQTHQKTHEMHENAIKECFKCDLCEKSYSCKWSLGQHRRTHPDGGNNPFKCDVCGKSYSGSWYLRQHRLTHETDGGQRFKCDVCGKSYQTNLTLQVHKRTHDGMKHYKCDVCEKSYFYLGSLHNHKQVHSRKEPLKCDICEKSYFYLSSLRQHNLIHHRKQRLKCDVCDKSYSSSGYLRQHKMKHSVKKGFE